MVLQDMAPEIRHLFARWDNNQMDNSGLLSSLCQTLACDLSRDSELVEWLSRAKSVRSLQYREFWSAVIKAYGRVTGTSCSSPGVQTPLGASRRPPPSPGSSRAPFGTFGDEPDVRPTGRARVPMAGYGAYGGRAAGSVAGSLGGSDYGGLRASQLSDGRPRPDWETGSMMSFASSAVDMNRERSRGGHGNILTWGAESRELTPPKAPRAPGTLRTPPRTPQGDVGRPRPNLDGESPYATDGDDLPAYRESMSHSRLEATHGVAEPNGAVASLWAGGFGSRRG